MKKFITSMFAMATLLTASAQMASEVQARVYAYNLQQEVDTESKDVTSYKITFQTNCAANEGEAFVLLMQDGEEVYRIPAEATDNTLKNWEAVVDVYTVQEIAGNVEAGDYNWSVEVAAGAVNSWTKLYNSGDNSFNFYRSVGLEVDKSPESDHFGRAYMAHHHTSGTNVPVGMYTFSPELVLENSGNPYKNNIFGMGEASASSTLPSSLLDMCIAKDGRLFFTATEATIFNVYAINPNDLTEVTKVFDEATIGTETFIYNDKDTYTLTNLTASNGERITGISGGLTVYGTGEKTTLMILEPEDIYLKYYTTPINEFNIGTSNTWDAAPSNVVGTQAERMKLTGTTKNVYFARSNSTYPALEATSNGFWGVQHNANPSVNIPTLFYYSRVTGMVEYEDINTYACNTSSTALAVNEELGLVAYGSNTSGTCAVISKYSEDPETGKITVSEVNGKDYKMSGVGTRADAMTFDYAGNLFTITSGKEIMEVYALPDALVGENKRVTPAKSDLLVKLTAEDITTGIVEVGVDADAAVEYYNLQGVKVENPSNGIFIKKQGNKTTKVVL